MGLSDMSYTSICESQNIIPHVKANMPLWGTMYDIPFETISLLNIPSYDYQNSLPIIYNIN